MGVLISKDGVLIAKEVFAGDLTVVDGILAKVYPDCTFEKVDPQGDQFKSAVTQPQGEPA